MPTPTPAPLQTSQEPRLRDPDRIVAQDSGPFGRVDNSAPVQYGDVRVLYCQSDVDRLIGWTVKCGPEGKENVHTEEAWNGFFPRRVLGYTFGKGMLTQDGVTTALFLSLPRSVLVVAGPTSASIDASPPSKPTGSAGSGRSSMSWESPTMGQGLTTHPNTERGAWHVAIDQAQRESEGSTQTLVARLQELVTEAKSRGMSVVYPWDDSVHYTDPPPRVTAVARSIQERVAAALRGTYMPNPCCEIIMPTETGVDLAVTVPLDGHRPTYRNETSRGWTINPSYQPLCLNEPPFVAAVADEARQRVTGDASGDDIFDVEVSLADGLRPTYVNTAVTGRHSASPLRLTGPGCDDLPIEVGHVVAPINPYEHVLASSGGRYDWAIVKSVEPFVLVSREGDMTWKCEQAKHYRVVGRVDSPPVKSAKCPTCMGAGVLKHFDPCFADEPCPSCPAPKVEGPSEWTVVSRERLDTVIDQEHVLVQKGQRRCCWVVSAFVQHWAEGTCTCVVATWQEASGGWVLGGEALRIRGEASVDMAIARLLCGLRDGTVKA